MTLPMLSASACFSGYSAGKEDEPGRVMPSASAADAMVLAVYIYKKGGFSGGGNNVEDNLHRRMRLHRDKRS